MKPRTRPTSRLLVTGVATIALLALSGTAHAQGVMFIINGMVGIGIDTPSELLHLFTSNTELKLRLEQGGATNAWAYSVINTNPTRPNAFRISKQGSGGPEIDIIGRNDPGGEPTMDVSGSIRAANFTFSSSRELKTEISPLDGKEILARVAELPLARWRLKTEEPGAHHVGPMAEDFNSAFEFSGDGKTISVVDANGIALAAIQGLVAEVQTRDVRIEQLAGEVEVLRELVHELAAQSSR